MFVVQWKLFPYFFSKKNQELSAPLLLEDLIQFDSGPFHTQAAPLVTMETNEHILTYPWESILPIIKQTQL